MQTRNMNMTPYEKCSLKMSHQWISVLSLLLIAGPAICQTNCPVNRDTTVGGVVRDPTKALIPDASLTLDSSITSITDRQGEFEFHCIPPGIHQLDVRAPGFAAAQLQVDSRRHVALDIVLRLNTVEQNVAVDATGSGNDESGAPGASMTIEGEQLQALSDDPDELLGQLQRLGALNGGDPTATIITVDGFQGQERVPPKSSIAYIRVNPDSYSAEYRQPPYAGGRVEVYTKPGQSAFHGALFATNSSPWENARDPFSTAKGSIGRQRYGFDLTGPLKKNSDFLLTLERRMIQNLAVVNADTLDANGNIVNTIGNVPTPQSLWNAEAKADWQLGSKNTLMLAYSPYINSQENVGTGGNALAETGYKSRQTQQALRITEITTASSALMHESKVALRWTSEVDTPVSSAPEVLVAGAFTAGGASVGEQRLHEFNLEIDDDIVATTKRHTFKAGTQFMYYRDDNQLTTNFNGAYTFGGGQAPVLAANNQAIPGMFEQISALEQYRRTILGLPGGTPTTYNAVVGDPQVRFSQVQDALFLQDSFKLTPRLLLSLGVRYFLQDDPTVLNSLTPRFGFNWSPSKSKRWSLHGHVGMFSGLFPTTDTSEVLREDGTDRTSFMIYDPVYGNPTAGATPIDTVRRFSPHLSNSSSLTENVGGAWEFVKGWSAMADFTLSRIWDDIRSANINSPFDGSPYGQRALGIPQMNLLEMQNSAHASVNDEYVGIQHYEKRYSIFVGGVRVEVVGTSDASHFSTAQSAFSDVGERAPFSSQPIWQLFAESSLSLPYKLQFSEDLTSQGDQHFNITSGFDRNGDGDFNDRPYYASAASPDAVLTRYGYLTNDAVGTPIRRNLGVMPWKVYLQANLQRSFPIGRAPKNKGSKALIVNLRSSNLINHTNVLQVGSILGSLQFGAPVSADAGRRIEGGVRYTF